MSKTLFVFVICSVALPTCALSAPPMDKVRIAPADACALIMLKYTTNMFEKEYSEQDYAEMITICNNIANQSICRSATEMIEEDHHKKSPLKCK